MATLIPTADKKLITGGFQRAQATPIKKPAQDNFNAKLRHGFEKAMEVSEQAEFIRKKNDLTLALNDEYNISRQDLNVDGYKQSSDTLIKNATKDIRDEVLRERLKGLGQMQSMKNVDSLNAEIGEKALVRDSATILNEYSSNMEYYTQATIDSVKLGEDPSEIMAQAAGDSKEMLDSMLDKGIITPQRYNILLKSSEDDLQMAFYEGRAAREGYANFAKKLQDPNSKVSKGFLEDADRERVLRRITNLQNIFERKSAEERAKTKVDLKNYSNMRIQGLPVDPNFKSELSSKDPEAVFKIDSIMNQVDTYKQEDPSKLDDEIRKMQSNDMNSDEFELYEALVDFKDYRDRSLEKDAISYWANESGEQLAGLDNIGERIRQYDAAKSIYGNEVNFLTPSEVEDFQTKANLDPRVKMGIINSFSNVQKAVDEIFPENPEYSFVDSVSLKKSIIGEEHFKNMDSKEQKSIKAEFQDDLQEKLSQIFWDDPLKVTAMKNMYRNLSAYNLATDNSDFDADEEINKLVGGVYDNDGNYLTGGIGEIGGFNTILPPNMDEDAFKDALSKTAGEDRRYDDFYVTKIGSEGNYYAIRDKDTGKIIRRRSVANPPDNLPPMVRNILANGGTVWNY